MLLNKSTLAICSSSKLPTFIWSQLPSASPYSPRATPGRRPQWRPNSPEVQDQGIRRPYATTRDADKHKSAPSFHDWPSHANPTPYQILDHPRHGPYSKSRFIDLVKIYHPDRQHHISIASSISPTVRLERYRLIVTANTILSDPEKRRAYDLYGAGWGGKASHENMYQYADKKWREQPGNASMNATWEDWERWRQERDGTRPKQTPIYVSNELFAAILCMFVVAISVIRAKSAAHYRKDKMEISDREHFAIAYGLQKRQMEQAGLSREEKINNFIRHREASMLGMAPERHGPAQQTDRK